MPQIGSQFKVRQYDGFGGGFIDSDYLAASYDAGKPHVFESFMGKLFTSTDRFTSKPLLGMTLAKGKVKEIDNEIYRWSMQGAEQKKLRQVQNLEVGNATPGIGNTTFYIKLDEDWFSKPDVIFPEDNEFPLEIVDGPIQDGTGYKYLVKLQDNDPTRFLPIDLLNPGREFSKVWTSVSNEFNQEYGTQQYPSSFQLESQVSAFAQGVIITDKALREGGRLGIPFQVTDKETGKTKMVEKFIPMAEAMVKEELYIGMEAQMMFGRKSDSIGSQGYWKKTGPGARQQMADGHTAYYNGTLTEPLLRDYLMDIFISRVNESDRKVVAMTGTGGSIMFHDLLARAASGFLTVDTNFITQIDKNPRHLSYGAQFTHYQGPEGIEVTLIKNPMYDSFYYSPRPHPFDKKLPIDSFRFSFLDFGKSEGEDNIQFLKVKDTYRHFYVNGSVTPNGPITNGGAANSAIAGYSLHCEGTAGLWIKDVTRTGELILEAE